MAGYLAGREIANDNTLGMAVDENEVEHFRLRIHLHRALGDLVTKARISPEQKLLARLSTSIKSTGNLGAAERAVVKQSAVFTGERHPLRNTLVDDVVAHLGEAVDIRFAGTEIAALDRVVKKPVSAIAIILVILRSVDATLRGDRVRAARAILIAEALHVVTLLGEGRSGGRASQTGADNDDVELPLVGRAHKLRVVFIGRPLVVEGTCGNVCVGCHCANPFPNPKNKTEIGMETYPRNNSQAIARPASS